jgi:hypothetical protein
MRYLLIITLLGLGLHAQERGGHEAPKRSLTLSSSYAERFFNSNEGLVEFPISVIEAYGALFDVATPSFTNAWYSRLFTSLLELPISYWLAVSLFVPFHEFGHARAFKAFGYDYSYGSHGCGQNFNLSNYWTLSLIRLITPPFGFPGSGHASTRPLGNPHIPQALRDYWTDAGAQIISSAGGLNNQSLLAKKIAQEIYTGHGHITQLQHYIGNKFSPFIYSKIDQNLMSHVGSSDISHILEGYKQKNYGITHGDIELQSWLSLLSATTISLFKGYADYYINKDTKVYPLEFFGIRMPDLNSYINSHGLSFEILTGYRLNNDLFFDLAYEFIWKGDNIHQVTPAAYFNLASVAPVLNQFWINADLVISKNLGGKLALSYMPFDLTNANFWQRFSYFLNGNFYNGFNLYGERNINSLGPTRTYSFDIFAGVKLNY